MSDISRLRWLCRRGMKELDVLMTGYLDKFYQQSSDSDKNSFKFLLDKPDPELNDLLLGRQVSQDKNIQNLIRVIRNMALQR